MPLPVSEKVAVSVTLPAVSVVGLPVTVIVGRILSILFTTTDFTPELLPAASAALK